VEHLGTSRPLTARSVIASTLLGMHPPRLSSRLLVASGSLFGIAEGTTRTAMSRMVRAGELEPDDGGYRLAGALLSRQARQDASRIGRRRRWTGRWELAVVAAERRPAGERAALREAARRLQLGVRREGVWLRPANLDPARLADAWAVVDAQCERFDARPSGDPVALAATLWDLDGWALDAEALRAALRRLEGPLERGDTRRLADAFVLSATVLRHLLADPLLPDELLAGEWPGGVLRAEYERFDVAFKAVWREWFRAQR